MDADASRFAADINWLDMYDSAEDKIMGFMNGVVDLGKNDTIRVEDIRRCRSEFGRFKKAVTIKIETQVENLAC